MPTLIHTPAAGADLTPYITEAEVDTKITDHADISDAHHTKTADGLTEADINNAIATHAADEDAHHPEITLDNLGGITEDRTNELIEAHRKVSNAHHVTFRERFTCYSFTTFQDFIDDGNDTLNDPEIASNIVSRDLLDSKLNSIVPEGRVKELIAAHAAISDVHHTIDTQRVFRIASLRDVTPPIDDNWTDLATNIDDSDLILIRRGGHN